MSLFRKPKKTIQRRIFSSTLDDDDDDEGCTIQESEIIINDSEHSKKNRNIPATISTSTISNKKDRRDRTDTKKSNPIGKSESCSLTATASAIATATTNDTKCSKKSLLSFADDEDDTEIFQVKKSSYSKKVSRMMDKERRKKRAKEERDDGDYNSLRFGVQTVSASSNNRHINNLDDNDDCDDGDDDGDGGGERTSLIYNQQEYYNDTIISSKNDKHYHQASRAAGNSDNHSQSRTEHSKVNKSDSIQTEIRTDDFVLVVKKSEPEGLIIRNGRAALCAGRDDMSDDDEVSGNVNNESDEGHRFSKPEQLKQMLESGSIPDAAMIHAARKRRQKAREQGEFIPVEETKEQSKNSGRLAHEDVEDENSEEDERVDMNAITGVKEREERREQFYSVENDYTDSDSDRETNEWENQQIRKGVTGAQLVTAQHESVLSRFVIKSGSGNMLEYAEPKSTSTLLEQAYAKSSLEIPHHMTSKSSKSKKNATTTTTKAPTLRTPQEIRELINARLCKLKELNAKHLSDIDRVIEELQVLKQDEIACTQKAPTAAAKYRFYQELRGYASDLVDCLSEKSPSIVDLEKRMLQSISRHSGFLIERRRQDVRDQVKEMTDGSRPNAVRKGPDNEEHIRRTAEREGRRTRRRCEREKNDLLNSHLDGMSSDDEMPDLYMEQYKASLDQIEVEADDLFADVSDEYFKIEMILSKFHAWRKTDIDSYNDAFVNMCIPKVLGPIIRMEMLVWYPLSEEYKDIEKMNWYLACMLYAWNENETEDTLSIDPDLHLVPKLIEKIVVPKVTEIVNHCWDPLSTTQTLRLIGLINRIGRDYPLNETSKQLKQLFESILAKMKSALDNDVFIPIYPKQVQEAKTSFFQRQFCSGLKLFRNFLSWQGIIADKPLRELAITSLLNRYLLLAMRVCSSNDALNKAYIVVNTLPTVWLQPESDTLQSLQLLITFVKNTLNSFDSKNPLHIQSCEKAKQILVRLHNC